VIALPGKTGTISEIALALSVGRTVILLEFDPGSAFEDFRSEGLLLTASDPEEAVSLAAKALEIR